MKIILFLAAAASLQALERTGFEIETGPGYRQDRACYTAEQSQEVYPHLRMFDWMVAFDASIGGLHLQGEGDRGWFSSQPLRKSTPTATYLYTALGKATTGALRLGYQIDLRVRRGSRFDFLPFAGWFYDSLLAHRKNPIPPPNAPVVLSNLLQRWSGPTLGGAFDYSTRASSLSLSYGYGWLRFHQTFSENDAINASTLGAAHGHLAQCDLSFRLAKRMFLNFDLRYFYLFSDALTLYSEQGEQPFRAQLNSASVAVEWALKF